MQSFISLIILFLCLINSSYSVIGNWEVVAGTTGVDQGGNPTDQIGSII